MKIHEVTLTESVALISDQDWQKLLSLLPGRLKDRLGISADRSYSVGSASWLLVKIDLDISSFTTKWRDIMQQIVPLLMPYVLKEIDIDLSKQQSYQGLNLSNTRLIAREFKQYIPELKNLLEKHRSMIVEKLLEFAENNPSMLTMDLSIINQLGLDWPELKTDVYRAYEDHLLNKFDKSYNVKTLYRLLREIKEHGHTIKDFSRLLQVADSFKEQLLFYNDTQISDTIWAMLESYMTNVDRFKSIGLPWPELNEPDAYARSVLNSRKQDTVKRLLQDLKSSAPEYPLKDIAALRSVGVDWPELDVIERSLKTDIANKRQINETQQSPFDATLVDQLNTLLPKLLRTRVEYLNNRFYFGPFIDFMFDVVKAKFSEAKKQRVFELLEPVVLESIDSYISSMKDPTFAFRHFMDYFEKLLTLAQYTDYDYSAVIDRNKASILKMVLASVRVYMNEPDNIGHWSRYQSYVGLAKLIKSWGLTWPELDKIVRSLASDRYIKTLNRTAMPQSKVLDFAREMLRDGMTVDQLTQSAQDTIEQMKPVFMAWHTLNFKWRTNMHYELDSTILDYFKKLNAIGLDWPEIVPYIHATTTERAEMQKRNIVTAMIKALKENEWDDLPAALKELRKLGITWPELSTIERSVNSLSNKQITETAIGVINQHHTASIASHLANGEPLQALRYMGERDITVDRLNSDLRAELEAQKADAVRAMLSLFKFDIQRFARFLGYVNNTRLDWPELAVLNRSLDAEYNRLPDEFARHRNY
jgi:hypothetical protein